MFALGLLVIITLGLFGVALSAIYRKLLSIERQQRHFALLDKRRDYIMSKALDDLVLEVEASKTTQASAIVAIEGIATQLDAAIASGADTATLEKLTADLRASREALAFAIDAQAAPGPMPADNDPDEPTPVEPVA